MIRKAQQTFRHHPYRTARAVGDERTEETCEHSDNPYRKHCELAKRAGHEPDNHECFEVDGTVWWFSDGVMYKSNTIQVIDDREKGPSMTILQRLMAMAINDGLSKEEAESITRQLESEPHPTLQLNLQESEEAYPEQMIQLLYQYPFRRVAAAWLATNKPEHWARPMFNKP